jgi:asparagine synthase (glutamine-hydrolysing)
MLNELFHEATPVILQEDDLNSMKYSIENRSPYLDVNLFDFAYSIPNEHLIQNGYGKYVLREAMNGTLNDQVRLDRRKKGFNASINSLVDLSDDLTLDYLMTDSPVFDILQKGKIEKLVKNRYFENSYNKFIFNFINTKLFIEQFA